ncbi:MAG: hypothetical protein KA956_10535 [Pyrinomonadaceae bacterium]|nr:sugar ABC transporter permease [Acidobacteriota bacterium]MBP7376900.1 hypothetical protein [Pyrinomonadaceae bacterium]
MDDTKKSLLTTSSLRAYIMIAVLGLIWMYFHWATDSIFLTPRNLSNLMTQMSVTGILAVGMLMLIVSGNIDLSVGSVLAFAGGIAAFALSEGYGLPASVMLAIVVGVAVGLFQGTLTAYLNIPAFIVTLGGLLAWRGAVKWLLGGNTIPISDDTFKFIGQGNLPAVVGWVLAVAAVAFVIFMAIRKARSVKTYGLGEANYTAELLKTLIPIGAIIAFIFVMNTERGGAIEESGVPVPVLILLAVALGGGFLTTSTTFGRYLYAIGGNADAARLSGINNKRNVLKVYAILGALTGVAALIFTARVGSGAPDAGTLKELDAIAACVIGGASLMGGRGTIFGACLGALIMASLDNGMSLLNVRDFMQDIIKGSILVAAVGLDMAGRKQG